MRLGNFPKEILQRVNIYTSEGKKPKFKNFDANLFGSVGQYSFWMGFPAWKLSPS